ncbi:MAG: hypothetical protein ACLQQ4_00250 [Bacteroidia bacterium]
MQMKCLLLTVFFVTSLLFSENTRGQSASSGGVFSTGDNVAGLGVGFGSFSNYGSGNGYTQTPSFVLTFEHATFDAGSTWTVGFGGYLSYIASSNTWTDGYTYSDNYKFEFLMARASLHYKLHATSKLDPYGGITLGYVFYQHDLITSDPNVSNVHDPGYSAYIGQAISQLELGAYLGARYYFTDRFGINGELVVMNNAYNYLGLGINYKL